uniref:dCTP pyrophosphatase 1 n=1 Tax=Zea mays TaxID=4577 RepID=B6TRG9_MAIZE|nr:mazG nucleotide pyrophosphohydrolase domain protein [Zea mays]
MEGEKKAAAVAEDEVVVVAAGDVSLKDLSKKLNDFARERDWEQFHSPRNLLLAMIAEVGELSELFMWRGEVRKGLAGWDEAEKEHLGEELSDVLLYLVQLSDMCGVDLGDAAVRKDRQERRQVPGAAAVGRRKKKAPDSFFSSGCACLKANTT